MAQINFRATPVVEEALLKIHGVLLASKVRPQKRRKWSDQALLSAFLLDLAGRDPKELENMVKNGLLLMEESST